MDRLLPELFPPILDHIPIVYRPSTCLSLALTSRHFRDIVAPSLLYKNVQYNSEEIALENLKHLTDDIQQRMDQAIAHCIQNLCIQSTIRLPVSESNSISLGWLKQLVELDGLKNLKALSIKLCAVQAAPDGSIEEFDFTDLWGSIKTYCPALQKVDFSGFPQKYVGKDWVFGQLISSTALKSIYLDIILFRQNISQELVEIPPFSENITNLKFNLGGNDSICMKVPKIIISSSYRNLRTLILLHVPIVTIPTKPFWKAHPNLERLELNKSVGGSWFEDFEEGMLPNLKFLKAGLMAQVDLIIPHVYRHLVSLTIPSSYNAQALYLLRGVVGGKPFPQLRYLGIHLVPRTYLSERGSDWRETEGGETVQSREDSRESIPPPRFFDNSYITSISKAAPYLTTLELMGPAKGSFNDLTASFAQLSCLHHLILSGPVHFGFQPFLNFSDKWEEYNCFNLTSSVGESVVYEETPSSFDDTVRRLAAKCRSLEKVTIGFELGDLAIESGIGARIIRDSNGDVFDVVKIKARGETLGREEDWY